MMGAPLSGTLAVTGFGGAPASSVLPDTLSTSGHFDDRNAQAFPLVPLPKPGPLQASVPPVSLADAPSRLDLPKACDSPKQAAAAAVAALKQSAAAAGAARLAAGAVNSQAANSRVSSGSHCSDDLATLLAADQAAVGAAQGLSPHHARPQGQHAW
jgi:hypothetical protein